LLSCKIDYFDDPQTALRSAACAFFTVASDTREAAVAIACALAATDEPSKVVIDNPDGTIAEERVFGTDKGLDPTQS